MEALNQKNSLNIRLLSSNNILLHNQEFKLYEIAQGNKNEIKTIFTTNRMGEAHLNASEIFSKEAQSFELILNQSSVYKNKPIYNHRFLLRSYEYGHWCEIKFERKADKGSINSIRLKSKEFTLENNEKIVRNFYTFGDIVEFEAIYEDAKIKEEQIKWGYVFIQDKNTLDKLNKNQLTNNKKESSLFDEEILKDCFYIEKEEDKALLSSSIIYRHLENNEAYCGKHLSLQLPNSKDTQEQKALLVFAYKEIPNYNASYLIRINDYPQITIDCTLAETLRAHTNKDEISRLGWGVSYICQRLWHDNPSDAKELKDLTFRSSTSQDFIDTIPNETMKTIVKEVLPRIEMKEFAREIANQCPKVKSQIQQNDENNLRFYVELDWDEFYMKFPLMKGLEEKILQVIPFEGDINQFVKGFAKELVYETTESIRRNTKTPKILHNNFLDSAFYNLIIEWLNDQSIQKDLNNILNNNNSNAKLVVKLHNIYQGFTKNEKIFSLKSNDWKSDNICENQSLIDIKQPYKLWGQCMRTYGLGDTAFFEYTNFKEAIALYALTGKFNIYYIPSLFKIAQGKDNKIDIQILEIKAYIFDGFDFIGTPKQFVGAWNYEEMSFIVGDSAWTSFKEVTSLDKILPTDNIKQANKNVMFNQDYQNTQTLFHLGCNFRILTSTFKDIEVYSLSMPISIKVD